MKEYLTELLKELEAKVANPNKELTRKEVNRLKKDINIVKILLSC